MSDFNQIDFLKKALYKRQKDYLDTMLEIYHSELGNTTDPTTTKTLLMQHIRNCGYMLMTLDNLFNSFEKSASHTEQEETHQ